MKDEKLALVANLFPPVSPSWQKWTEVFEKPSTNQQLSQESRDLAAGFLNVNNAVRLFGGVVGLFDRPKAKRRRRKAYRN